jgi:tetratricopeptide (TPR) repeat protein
MEAWREVLWFNPSDAGAAARIARACELSNEKDAVACWLKVIAINPAHEKANARLRKLVQRHDLEDHVIRGLVEMGRDEHTDPFIREFAENRDAKARIAHERFMKTRLREALMRARAVDRTSHPRLHLELWKNVLMLDPKHSAAARKVINSARQLRDYSELVDGLMAHLEITPGDFSLAERLAQAAMRAGHEERVLEYLARHRMMDLSMRHMENLQKRVLQACRNAMRVADFEHALNCFRALELADHKFPPLESLRPVLIQRSASKAKEAEKQGNLGVAVPLAQKVLQIAPDQPGALTVVARDLWRHRRFSDLVELCGPRVKAGPKYAYVQKLLDQAAIKMAA